MVPPLARPAATADSLPVKHLHSSLNKAKYPINVVCWTPEGRRLLTASSSGEFTLWNGMSFNFELIMQAHESAIRTACYSHKEDWLISADQDGIIKYWQPNFNNVKEIQAHNETIRGLAFSPSDSKFASAGDDAAIKIFDFARGHEESVLTGHQWEIRSLDWHPTKGLLVTGSKDHSVKLWDPRSTRCLTTLSSSKNQVSRTLFEKAQGQLLATAGRDQIIRIIDLRMMREVFLLRGHENEITSLAWHPIHRNFISSGGHSGAIHHYLLDEQNPPPNLAYTLSPYDSSDPSTAPPQTIFPAHSVLHAHEPTGPVWSLSWHPLGHVLASGSNDRVTRFWTRARPGDASYLNDKYHIGQHAAEERGTYNSSDSRRQQREAEEQEAEDEAEGLTEQTVASAPSQLPGIGLPGIAMPSISGFTTPAINMPFPPVFPTPTGMPPLPPGMDPNQLKTYLASMNPDQLKLIFGGANASSPPLGFLPHLSTASFPGMPLPPFPLGNLPSVNDHMYVDMSKNLSALTKRLPLPSQEEVRNARAHGNLS